MWREIYNYGKQLINLASTTEQNQGDVEKLRLEVKELSSAVQHLAYEFKRLSDNERHEREKMLLRLENHLLRFERGLPPSQNQDE
ncbi:MAG: hypothetical protein ABI210_11610 [Abditibacteriaceae bacterium]